MRRNGIVILCLVLLIGIINHSSAEEAKQITCKGKVVDDQGHSIADAKVTLHEMVYNKATRSYDTKVAGEVTTETGGAFSFNTSAESDVSRDGYIIVEKEGLALGFANWEMRKGDKELQIKLGQPKELAGVVVDENDKPVAGAQVSILMLIIGTMRDDRGVSGPVAADLFTSTTDAAGKFKFTRIPAEATAEFIMKKEGRATVGTYISTGMANQKLKFVAGQADIKLVLPNEAKIEGIVVQKETAKPVGGINLIAKSEQRLPYLVQEPIVSRQDGTFGISALIGGRHIVQIESSSQGLADWVAESVAVTTEAGKTKSGIKIEISKGGLVEVVVTEADSKKPVENASISIRELRNKQWFNARSDKDGIARIRLAPGTYQMSGAYKQGFTSNKRDENITIEDGKTILIAWQLSSQPRITGIVRDMAGKPLEGVKLTICPMGGRDDSATDSEGKFEISWTPRRMRPDRDSVYCLVARHEKLNLAAAEEITEDMKKLDMKLHPGVIFEGKVVDPDGKGIADARINVMLRMQGWSSTIERDIARTDSQGNFRIRAVPPEHKYNINARAEGYGQTDVDIQAQQTGDKNQDLGQMELPLANLSVSGRLVDAQGNPVANARIHTYGGNQPSVNTLSDAQGNFIIKGVCTGRIYISTDVEHDGKRLSSRVTTDGGATGIKIVVREGRAVSYYIKGKTYEQVLNSSDMVIAGVAVDENGLPVAGVPVGVRSIKREREKGKYSWTYASYQTLSDITDEKGRFAIELEEDAEYTLLFSPEEHAAIIAYDVPVNTKDLKITLPNGGSVAGRLVRMEKGKKVPIPNAEVKIEQTSRISYTHLGFDRDRTTLTDSSGYFRFEHLRTKIRPLEGRSEKQWEYIPRIWQISCGEISKTIGFYEGTTIDDFELIIKPKLAEAVSLVNKPLPEFDGINIDLTPEQTKGKMVLVCFFDMNQRPSRHYIMQLKNRTKELKAKDISIIAIQAANIDADALNAWVKDSGVQFPVGLIEGDANETRTYWSVRSLPWLILTDKQHKVCAEGFNLSELDEKIRTAQNK
ncbi:MAG: redoxin domain-containing protein [Planctomycetes bacterium]|nr:redoxin domain-containing protein [Planctomycetota bacterium]